IGNESGGQRTVKKQEVRGRMQPFEAKRRLAFAGPDAERRSENRVHVRVLYDQHSSGEVRVEIELKVARKTALQVRTRATQRERVYHRVARIFQREAAVGLQEQPDLQTEVAVGRL